MFLGDGVLFKVISKRGGRSPGADCGFQLHKVILCRDPESMFRDMFSMPQDPQAKNLDPIPLLDDSAEQIRALCWAVYALSV